ncbi:hypothetical protein D3C85_814390 [compost metagenome]
MPGGALCFHAHQTLRLRFIEVGGDHAITVLFAQFLASSRVLYGRDDNLRRTTLERQPTALEQACHVIAQLLRVTLGIRGGQQGTCGIGRTQRGKALWCQGGVPNGFIITLPMCVHAVR